MANNKQFGRFVEIEIRDFEANVKTVISNDFEIEFDYFKTLDQTQEDDSGRIKIYGLTEERIASLQMEGGEVILRCGYINSNIETLFVSYIARLYAERSNNTTITTIECSANLLNYYYTGNTSGASGGKAPIAIFLHDITKQMGASGIAFHLDNVPEKDRAAVQEYLETFPVKIAQVGSLASMLGSLTDILGIAVKLDRSGGQEIVDFTILPIGVERILNSISSGYEKVSYTNTTDVDSSLFFTTLKDSEKSGNVFVLDSETGLIDSKTEYKIATAYEDQAQELNKNEVETLKSQQRRNSRNAKEEERAAKAKAKGKEYKPKVATKRTTIQINRRYNRVKALLNPLVKPQSIVAVFEKKTNEGDNQAPEDYQYESVATYSSYRVRSASYKGNNKRNDWIMDLYCEDTESNAVTPEDVRRFLATNPQEDIEIEGEEPEI